MPSKKFSHSTTANSPLSQVWQAMDDPKTWEAISGIDRVLNPDIGDDGALRGFEFETVIAGTTYLGKATPSGRQQEEMIGWDIQNSEIRGRVEVRFTPKSDGTEIAVILEMASAGMLSGVLFPMLATTVGNGFPRTVEDFAAQLSGQA